MAGPPKLTPGEALPRFVRAGTAAHWARFAAVNDEFAPHHWDDAVAQAEGFPAAFAMAPLLQAYLQAMVRDWAGDAGRVLRLDIRLRSPLLRGRSFIGAGEVVEVRAVPGAREAELTLTAHDDIGALLITGAATVAFAD